MVFVRCGSGSKRTAYRGVKSLAVSATPTIGMAWKRSNWIWRNFLDLWLKLTIAQGSICTVRTYTDDMITGVASTGKTTGKFGVAVYEIKGTVHIEVLSRFCSGSRQKACIIV